MVTCPRCGSQIDNTGDGSCPLCGGQLSLESTPSGEQDHNLQLTEHPPRQPGMWRVWVSLVVFGGLVTAFFGLVGLARLEDAAGPAGEQLSAVATNAVAPPSRETTDIELDTRRVMLVVREQVNSEIRPGEALSGLLREKLETAGFESVNSSEDSDLRDQARRAGSASFLVCIARATSREGQNGSGVPHTRVSMTTDLQVHQVGSRRVLYARRASGHAMDATLEDALETAHDEVTLPLVDKALAKLTGLLDSDVEGATPPDLQEPAAYEPIQEEQGM